MGSSFPWHLCPVLISQILGHPQGLSVVLSVHLTQETLSGVRGAAGWAVTPAQVTPADFYLDIPLPGAGRGVWHPGLTQA
jgi:hypothetical protein